MRIQHIFFLLLLSFLSSKQTNAEEAEFTDSSSYLEKKIRSEDADEQKINVVHLYKPNYLLSYNYNKYPDTTYYPNSAANGRSVQHEEMKGQISVIVPLSTNILSVPDFSFGTTYTQLMFWQIYQELAETYMREINYSPSFYLRYLLNPNYLVSLSYDHQSNGIGGTGERLINKITGTVVASKGPWYAQLSSWYTMVPFSTTDINKYLGYTSIDVAYQIYKFILTAHVQNTFESQFARGQFIFSISYPLFSDKLSAYAQYFNGYGESITEFNHFTQTYGIGLALSDLIP